MWLPTMSVAMAKYASPGITSRFRAYGGYFPDKEPSVDPRRRYRLSGCVGEGRFEERFVITGDCCIGDGENGWAEGELADDPGLPGSTSGILSLCSQILPSASIINIIAVSIDRWGLPGL